MREKTSKAATTPDMEKTLGSLIVVVYVIGALALGAYVLFFAFFHHARISSDPGDWGVLGDYFGGLLNPVISFATLVVAYAVWKQQKEELSATKQALEEQAATAEQQRQEQRFFDLLNLYQQTLSAISVVAKASSGNGDSFVSYSGKEAIAQILRSPAGDGLSAFNRQGYDIWVGDFHHVGQYDDLLPIWNSADISSQLDHYFRVVFRIVSEAQALLGNQHVRYVKLFRAQLSSAELIAIGFNLWLDEEGRKLIPLAEKYGLLKHLPTGHLRSELEKHMPPSIFGKRFADRLIKQQEAAPC